MHKSEWSQEFLDRKEAFVRNYTAYVVSTTGYQCGLASDAAITDAYWQGDAVIVEYRNGSRVRYYGPYGSQREQM